MTDATEALETGGSADQTPTGASTPADAGGGPADKSGKAADPAKATDKKAVSADGGSDKGAGDPPPWYEALPDDLKGEKTILRHANLEDAVRALVGAEKRLGVPADQLVRLPSKPEEMGDLYRKLGAPETPDGYKIALPENASDEDRAAAKSFAEHMHKAGPFPRAVVEAALAWNNQMAEASAKALEDAQTAAKEAGEAFLKDKLGAAYDPDMKAVGQLLNELGGKELAEEFNARKSGSNPRLMLAFHKVIERLGEPSTLDGNRDGTDTPGKLTRGQAKAALETLENDPLKGKALRDSSHPMHKSVLAERTRLARMAEGIDPDA